MRTRLSLLFAAAVMAFTFQVAMAEEADDMDDMDEIAVEEDFGPMSRRMHPRWNDDGPDGMRGPRHMGKWDGRGPDMRHHGRGMHRGMMGGGMGMGMGRGMMGPRFMEMLDLDQAQKVKVVDIMTENFRAGLMARMELADAHKKLRDIYKAEKPDHDGIIAANQAIGAAQGKLEVLGHKMRDDVRAVLTPDQVKKLDDFDKRPPRRDRDDRKDGPRDGKRPPRPMPGHGPDARR